MTNLKTLMDAASPFPWAVNSDADIVSANGRTIAYVSSLNLGADSETIVTAANALPAVLKYMEGGHHGDCAVRVTKLLDHESWGIKCTCGYTALRSALGLQEASDEP